jgi:Stress responsive A/B Barrel Domain
MRETVVMIPITAFFLTWRKGDVYRRLNAHDCARSRDSLSASRPQTTVADAALLRLRNGRTHSQISATMKIILFLSLIGIAFAACVIAADAPAKESKLRHVVAFKFKDATTKEKIKEVEDAFRGLKGKIPEIVAYEWGTNISPEKHDKGFTHGFILTFKSEKDRDVYLEHAEHKKFGGVVGPVLGDVFVIDFWAKD